MDWQYWADPAGTWRAPGRPPLSKVFYADNGSAGVEVALKMAFHWFHNRGETRRTKFVALENGYHGETLGALSVGDIPLYRRVYAPLLTEALFAPSPDAWKAEVDIHLSFWTVWF